MEKFKTAKLFDAGGDIHQRWFIHFYFRDPDTDKFVRFREWISSKVMSKIKRYDIAREKIKTINTKLSQGWNPFSGNDNRLESFRESITFALQCKERSVRLRTYHTYSCHCGFLIRYAEEQKLISGSISHFNTSHARSFMDWYQKTRGVSNRTYNNMLLSMNAIFNFLFTREYIDVNPFSRIGNLNIEQPSIIAFNAMERKIIRENLPEFNYDLYIICELIFTCFLRPQELCRLRVENVDLVRKRITIPGTVSKNRKNEVVVITNSLLNKLVKLDMNYSGDYFLFSRRLKRGEKEIMPQRITEAWNDFAGKHGIKKGIYAAKHTGNGLAVEKGITVRDLQLQNRHGDLKMTTRYLDRFSRDLSDRFFDDFPEL